MRKYRQSAKSMEKLGPLGGRPPGLRPYGRIRRTNGRSGELRSPQSKSPAFREKRLTNVKKGKGEISRRLWALDDGARYEQRLKELLDDLWDEVCLLDLAEKISAAAGTTLKQTDQIVNFISRRKQTLAADLEVDMKVGTRTPDPAEPLCDAPPAKDAQHRPASRRGRRRSCALPSRLGHRSG